VVGPAGGAANWSCVVRRPHLSIVPAHGIRPFAPHVSRQLLVTLAVAAAVLAFLYLAARETSLFALRTLEISGAPPAVRAEVERAAGAYLGKSLVSLDRDELRTRLEALPTVRSIRYDRAFPHTLRLFVVPEQPAAVARSGADSWLVSARGRVIGKVAPGDLPLMPRIWIDGALAPGNVLRERSARLALSAVTELPGDFPVAVRRVKAHDGRITLLLAGGAKVRLGDRSALPLKLAAAARVLRVLSPEERSALGYLDLSVPDRPVAADKPQLSG
jgi:cell division protein FtsQ